MELERHTRIALLLLAAFGAAAGCGGDDPAAAEDDLTSVTARERKLTFDGYIYVDADATDFQILSAVRRETKTAFGALRTAEISVNNRELSEVDAKGFVKEPVSIVDPENPAAAPTPAMRVRYRYTDRALIPKKMAHRSAIGLAVMNGNYQAQSQRILEECTENTKHDQEFEGSIWYVFNPSLDACRDAIEAEEQAIQTARKGLETDEITQTEFDRLYLPVTVRLEATATSKAQTFPEYDRLWRGGVEPGKVVVGMVSGVMADWAAGEKPELYKDIGYHMFYEQMAEIEKTFPNLTLKATEGTDLTTFTANGKTVSGVTWKDLENWEIGFTGWPANFVSFSDRDALRKAVANKLSLHWLRFEAPVSVSIAGGATEDVTVVINGYYGAETSDAPHRRALQTSDVVIYNGHSYIGFGPLDPSRYDAGDFPGSYQIFFFNSCVSFNYYEKDFFKMKEGATANLDMVTNGLESWVNGSGPAVGRFVAHLLNGKQESYKNLLIATATGAPSTNQGIDALRVVDGEVDNVFKPWKTKIVVTPR